MGTGASRERSQIEATKQSRLIDRELRNDRIRQATKIKLLLLGTSESGKSTLAKQMRIIYQEGFSAQDRLLYKSTIHWNIVDFMVAILRTMTRYEISFDGGKESEDSASTLLRWAPLIQSGQLGLDSTVAGAIQTLWSDSAVRSCFHNIHDVDCLLSAQFFFESIDRIAEDSYVPSDEDILRSRVQTSGVIETQFQHKDYTFCLCDVGGQRTERRKWIHCFDNVAAILFTVAMSHYDMMTSDNITNRLKESLRVFTWVCEQEHLISSSIILFLNQKDVLMEKIVHSPFSRHFRSYKGRETYEEISLYIRSRFESIAHKENKDVFSHFTNAIDTRDTEFAMEACMAVILKTHLQEAAMW